MEIVFRGTPKKKIFESTCRSCASVLRAERHELRVEHDPRDYTEFGHAKCPVCNAATVFYPRKIAET